MFKGFIGATLSPSQCCRNPLVLLLPLLFGDLERRAGGGLAFLGKGSPSLALRQVVGEVGNSNEQGLLGGWKRMGLPPGVWRSRSVGFVGGT